jgi:hypothetical protein
MIGDLQHDSAVLRAAFIEDVLHSIAERSITAVPVSDPNYRLAEVGFGSAEPVEPATHVRFGAVRRESHFPRWLPGPAPVPERTAGPEPQQDTLSVPASEPRPFRSGPRHRPPRVVGGVLRVRAGAADDFIQIELVAAKIAVVWNGQTTTFPLDSISTILVRAGRGDDRVELSEAVSVSAELRGRPGDDTLRGGNGHDRYPARWRRQRLDPWRRRRRLAAGWGRT